MKNLRCFLNKQISKSSVISGLKIKAQNDALTHSNSSVDFNEIERQFRTIGKRQSTVVQRSRDEILADVKRPGRPPPPIPVPYSRHREFKAFVTEGETHRPQSLTPPLPQRKLNLKDQSDVNLISFEGQANSSLFSSLQQPQQQNVPMPIPRRQTIPYSLYPNQPNYGTTSTNLLLITPATDTTLDELLSYSKISKEEFN